MGIFITLAAPTKPMKKEAVSAGFYVSPSGKKYARIQILTIEDLLDGRKPEHPDYAPELNFKKARKEKSGKQGELLL